MKMLLECHVTPVLMVIWNAEFDGDILKEKNGRGKLNI